MKHPALIVTIVGLVAIPFLAVPSRAEQPAPATERVCVGGGGESIVVAEWTAERIAAWERERGRPLPRVHPETGTCDDPAGLSVVFEDRGGSAAYLCSKDANGRWHGPGWTWSIYVGLEDTPPDPTTGGCPAPRAEPSARPPESRRAAALAVYFSQLEAAGDFDLLYDWMHPDAKTEVSREAVVGWYEADFAPLGPEPIEVDRVRFVDWTWGVTGRTYPNTAEIAYRQRFANGSDQAGTVRLVRDGDVWRWFFGRDRAFVEEQETRFGGRGSVADGPWLDGNRTPWNVRGMTIPVAPTERVPSPPTCAPYVRPTETPEDAAVAAQGWRLYGPNQRGWGIVLVGGFLNLDVMCRPVVYQQFVFVDGVFAGTLAPAAMYPRTDGALVDAGIATGDRVYATYQRYTPADPLCCPSDTTLVRFTVDRTLADPVVVPDLAS